MPDTSQRSCPICAGTGLIERPIGILNGRAKLTEIQVQAIRRRRARDRQSLRSLAELFGVSKKQIENIVYGRSWTHVP